MFIFTSGCAPADAPIDEGESGDGDGGSTDGSTGATGDGDDSSADDSNDDWMDPCPQDPEFISFTVTPSSVTEPSAVWLRAEIENYAEAITFHHGNTELGGCDGDPTICDYEWIVSGAEYNGVQEFTALAEVDPECGYGTRSDPVLLEFDMPAGGSEVEQWSYDNGPLDALYDVTVDAEAVRIVLTGQASDGMTSVQRTERVDAGNWDEPVLAGALYASAVIRHHSGEYLVLGASPTAMDSTDSILSRYGSGGWLLDEPIVFDASSQPDMVDDPDSPIGAEYEADHALILGVYTPSGGPVAGFPASWVRSYSSSLDLEWERFPSETLPGRPFAHEIAARGNGDYVLAGGRFADAPASPWFALFDGMGEIVQDHDVAADGTFHAVDCSEDWRIAVAGQRTSDGDSHSWVQTYAIPDSDLVWEVDVPSSTQGVTTAVIFDPFGEVVTLSTEHCALVNARYSDCDLAVRKYDPEGGMMWEQSYATNNFLGPDAQRPGLDPSIAIDRYGYIYIAATLDTPQGTDWWARKLNP